VLADVDIRSAISDGLMAIEPLASDCLQPARYDMRVGHEAYVSSSDGKIDVKNKGLVIIDPGEFAVVITRERVRCGPQIAGQLGLSSTYARQGLTLLSGPQIDPGFDGHLIVRVINLAPRRITLGYEGGFLTTQYFKLDNPVEHPYSGSRQGQSSLSAKDIEGTADPDSPTLGGMVKSLSTLAADVGSLKTSVKWMAWTIAIGLPLVVAVVGIIVAVKG
jgi:dCTP deaminase